MGSDFPVEKVNPFYGIHAAVTRQDADNLPEVWRNILVALAIVSLRDVRMNNNSNSSSSSSSSSDR